MVDSYAPPTDIIGIHERVPFVKALPLSFQHLFAMFGASILVPILFKVDPSTVLLFNGIGTLIYLIICQGKIPAFLGSSFAFLAPTLYIIIKFGYEYALGGFIVSGLMFILFSLLIKKIGINWIKTLLPAAAIGPIVAVIGLELGPIAAKMAGLTGATLDIKIVIVSMVTLISVILASVLFRGFMKTISILFGVIIGYTLSVFLGIVNLESISTSSLFTLPVIYFPQFNLLPIMIMLPAVFVVLAEHIGHLVVTGNIVEKDLMKDPGLSKSLLGNGLSTFISGLFGAVPTTTYAENIGVLAITRVYSTWIIGGAAILSIIMAFSGKLSSLIKSIPDPVIGGISLLLFGIIAASGLRILIEEKVDYSKSRNLILSSMILLVGLSGIEIVVYQVPFKGMVLATVVAICLNLFFILFEKLGLTNDQPEFDNSSN